MATAKSRLLIFVSALLFSFLFFSFLETHDNKYKISASQPLGGVLWLTRQEADRNPLRFLHGEWRFFPDRLLTPEEVRSGKYYSRIIRPGRSRFGKDSSAGAGTYYLRLKLPEKERTYALELPEIYSAYELWIGNKMVGGLGSLSPINFEERTGAKVITFAAAASIDLTLAVVNKSHFYGGLTYPPAFGTLNSVLKTVNGRIASTAAVASMAMIVALLSLWFAFRLRERRGLFFAALCAAFCGHTVYPLLHSFAELPVRPWYAIEVLSFFLMLFFIVVLISDVCKVGRTVSRVTASLFFTAVLFSLFYCFFLPVFPVVYLRAFSILSYTCKAAAALYLLWASGRALYRGNDKAAALVVAGIFYAVSLFCDRIWPDFEPVYGGWFPEWGGVAVIFSLGYLLWNDISEACSAKLRLEEELKHTERGMKVHLAYIQRLGEKVDENRRFRHDFRHHIRVLSGLCQKGETEGALDYLRQIGNALPESGAPEYTMNQPLNALVGYYVKRAQDLGISFEVSLPIPPTLPIKEIELCSVFGNLTENALDASGECEEGMRHISLRAVCTEETLHIIFENSYKKKLKKLAHRYLSTKHPGPATGIESVYSIIRRAGGTLCITEEKNIFTVVIELPLAGDATEG